MPVMESKPADVFAFAMFAVEVFTGNIPFEGRTFTTAALDALEGKRPEIPGNAQEMGLTGEMLKFLESCWHQDPEKRPTMEEVVRRWRRFVVRNNNDRHTTAEWVPSNSDFLFDSVLNFLRLT